MPSGGTLSSSDEKANLELDEENAKNVPNDEETVPTDVEMGDSNEEELNLRALPESVCHLCCNPVAHTDAHLECFGRCKQQVHTGCLGVPIHEIEVLQRNKNAAYVCDACFALDGFDDRAMFEDTVNEVVTAMEKLQCVFDFVNQFESKVRKIVREECTKIVMAKSTENVTGSGRVLRSAKKRKMAEKTEGNVVEKPVENSNETPKSSTKGSYASIVQQNTEQGQSGATTVSDKSSDTEVKEIKKPNPKLVIAVKNKKDKTEISKVLKAKVDRKSLSIKDVKTRQDGAVVVELLDEESVNKLKERVEKCMGDQFEVGLAEAQRPTVKMIDMENEMDENELKAALKLDNPIMNDVSYFKLRKCYAQSKQVGTMYNAIFEVDAVTYHKIMKQRRLLCNWDSCRVFDGLDVLRCYKCCGYNHKGAECKADAEICPRCAGAHSVKQCKSTTLKCANCAKAKNGDPSSAEHAAWSETCPVYQNLKSKKKKSIDYTV